MLNTERIKSFILFSLVIMSFVLTTRIWFNVSIEGLFVIPPDNNSMQSEYDYDVENLLKPSKMVVHTGQSHTLVLNDLRDKEYYSFILNGSKDVLKDWLNNNGKYSLSSLSTEKLHSVREGRVVELVFEYPMKLANIKGLLDIESNSWNEINDISSIIIDPYENNIYIVDESNGVIHQFASRQMPNVLVGVIAQIERRNDFAYVLLNEFNNESYEMYGDYAIAPLSIVTMPALTVKSEVVADTKITPEISKFFNDESSSISSMKDAEQKITFTDREEETLTIDAHGALEYYKYNVASENIEYNDVREAINTASQYVNQHLGFTYDFFLSGVESRVQGGRTSFIISFDYKYEGVPIITELDTGSSAIEVEVLGKEVKRYKRNVRVIEDQGKSVNIMSFEDILNIVWGDLDNKLNTTRSESIVVMNDLYLAYLERNGVLIPIWSVDVTVEDKDGKQYDRKFIIGAEEGEIGVILDEQ